jgi:hypothetical protein
LTGHLSWAWLSQPTTQMTMNNPMTREIAETEALRAAQKAAEKA